MDDAFKHDDAYPWNCRACIHDPRPAGDDSLFEEHVADVRRIRAVANPSDTHKRFMERPRRRVHRHRRV